MVKISEQFNALFNTHSHNKTNAGQDQGKIPGIVRRTLKLDEKTSLNKPLQINLTHPIKTPSSECEVKMNEGVTSTSCDSTILYTRSLMDCTAILVMRNYSPETNSYGERRMIHLQGGELLDADKEILFKDIGSNDKILIALGYMWDPGYSSTSYVSRIMEAAINTSPSASIQSCTTVFTNDPIFYQTRETGSIKLHPNGQYEACAAK